MLLPVLTTLATNNCREAPCQALHIVNIMAHRTAEFCPELLVPATERQYATPATP